MSLTSKLEAEAANTSPTRLDDLYKTLDRFISFLEPYRLWLDSYNAHFLVDNFWDDDSIVNTEFRKDLQDLIDRTKPTVNLVKYYHEITTNKQPTDGFNSHVEKLCLDIAELRRIWDQEVLTSFDALSDPKITEKYDKAFKLIQNQNRFMNGKKVHEVDTMSKLVAELCEINDVQTIVDIGSGRAYLSTQLSSSLFESPFNVIAIDSKQTNVQSSQERLKTMKKFTKLMKNEEATFQTFSQFIQSSSELNNLVESHLKEISLANNKYALIGLHSCGNLSNSIVNLYVNSHRQGEIRSGCRLLCNVACCYNQLDEKYIGNKYANEAEKALDVDEASKFPMSARLNEIEYCLGPSMTRVACHSFEKNLEYYDDISEVHGTSGLHTLWIRCLLWKLVLDRHNNSCSVRGQLLKFFRNKGDKCELKNHKKNCDEKMDELTNFVHYMHGCLERLKLSCEIMDEEIVDYFRRYAPLKHQFDVFLQLKILMGPIVEYVVLLDRLIYLYEFEMNHAITGVEHYLIKIFDPTISPRCHAMVSFFNNK